MGKNRKSRQSSDSPKQKQKPGKTLKKTNATNTTNIVVKCMKRLGYIIQNIPQQVYDTLLSVVSVVRQSLNRTDYKLSTCKKFWIVFQKIVNNPSNVLQPHFTRLCSTISRALTNSHDPMRYFALKAFVELAKNHSAMVAVSRESFKCLTRFYSIDCDIEKVPGGVMKLATDVFPAIFSPFFRSGRSNAATNENFTEIILKETEAIVTRVRIEPNRHDFPVIGYDNSSEFRPNRRKASSF